MTRYSEHHRFEEYQGRPNVCRHCLHEFTDHHNSACPLTDALMEDEAVHDVGMRIELTAKKLDIFIVAAFVPCSQSRNAERALTEPTLNWKVTLWKGPASNARPILEDIDYSAGCAHVPGHKQMDTSKVHHDAMVAACETGYEHRYEGGYMRRRPGAKPIMPKPTDVLASFAIDSDVIDAGGFEEWCSSYGFDSDSRKAKKTYDACLAMALKLRAALGDDGLRTLREACDGY